MLFFIDESWQNIGGQEIGALGGVGIPEPLYNHFCREVFAFKRDVLGAEELKDSELRGTSCFAKSAFRKREATGHSRLWSLSSNAWKLCGTSSSAAESNDWQTPFVASAETRGEESAS